MSLAGNFNCRPSLKARFVKRVTCFISYAWGDRTHEHWVENRLALDLRKAEVAVILDRWENARIGRSIPRFVSTIDSCDQIVVVGTPLYLSKYENKNPDMGYVVAAEMDIVLNRLLGTEEQKETVLPILLDGDRQTSFPPHLRSRTFADFRNDAQYFESLLHLIMSIYRMDFADTAVLRILESFRRQD